MPYPPAAIVPAEVNVVPAGHPVRAAIQNRGLKVGPAAGCIITVDGDRLIGEQVQHGRKWSGKPVDDRVAAYPGGEDIGQVRPMTAHLLVDAVPDGIIGEVVTDRAGEITAVDVGGHQSADVILGLQDVDAGVRHGTDWRPCASAAARDWLRCSSVYDAASSGAPRVHRAAGKPNRRRQ